MDVNDLLLLLNEQDVINKIRSIANDNKSVELNFTQPQIDHSEIILSLENENQLLKSEVEDMKGLILKFKQMIVGKDELITQNKIALDSLELESKKLKKNETVLQANSRINVEQLNLVENQLEIMKRHLEITEKKLTWYRDNFCEDIAILDVYQSLSEVTRTSLDGIFKDKTAKGLVACGIQEKNINNLWDYARNEAVNGSNSNINQVIKLFELLFNRFTIAFPMYELQQVNSGDDFDVQQHIKHNNSKNMSGKIVSVILPGYVNNKTRKVIKQAVVII